MCRSFFGYGIFMPDLFYFYTFANKTCFAFVLSQIKKPRCGRRKKLREKDLRPKKGLRPKRATTEKDYG